jgi:transketolase
VFSRQKLPVLDRTRYSSAEGVRRGGYVLWESERRGDDEEPEIILIGTGSEVKVALEAGQTLDQKDGYRVRVVSMPCWELFDAQPAKYRRDVLPPSVRVRVAVEAGITTGWEHYVGLEGATVGIDHFGASAPEDVLFEKFGITPQNVANTARRLLGQEDEEEEKERRRKRKRGGGGAEEEEGEEEEKTREQEEKQGGRT